MHKKPSQAHSQTDKAQAASLPESLIEFKTYLTKVGRKELSLVQKKLNYLCMEFDPYTDTELTQEEQNIIEEYELSDYVGNPFAFTNIILQMMDILETEIKSRSH